MRSRVMKENNIPGGCGELMKGVCYPCSFFQMLMSVKAWNETGLGGDLLSGGANGGNGYQQNNGKGQDGYSAYQQNQPQATGNYQQL